MSTTHAGLPAPHICLLWMSAASVFWFACKLAMVRRERRCSSTRLSVVDSQTHIDTPTVKWARQSLIPRFLEKTLLPQSRHITIPSRQDATWAAAWRRGATARGATGDDEGCNEGANSDGSEVNIESKYWLRLGGTQNIHYIVSTPTILAGAQHPAPTLLLNGFGVGAFHWERNQGKLARATGGRVYCMDYVGQGNSWPVSPNDGNSEAETGLRYAIDDWIKQVEEFVEEIMLGGEDGNRGVNMVGNSVGGLIAAILAAKRPDLVESVVLVNATPLWGSNFPGWDGRLGPGTAALPRAIGRIAYDRMRDEGNIRRMLSEVYEQPEALGTLPAQIRDVTTDVSTGADAAGHAAFSSILWSPPATMPRGASDYYDVLRMIKAPVMLLFGKKDPWCSPEFGRAAARALAQRQQVSDKDEEPPVSRLYFTNGGHCPHHEVPREVNWLLSAWISGDRQPADIFGEGPVEDIEALSLRERFLVSVVK